eukprot:4927584-Pyramimonas_sp.AAC.1
MASQHDSWTSLIIEDFRRLGKCNIKGGTEDWTLRRWFGFASDAPHEFKLRVNRVWKHWLPLELDRLAHQSWLRRIGHARLEHPPGAPQLKYLCYTCGETVASVAAWRRRQLEHDPIDLAQKAAWGNQCGACGRIFGNRS